MSDSSNPGAISVVARGHSTMSATARVKHSFSQQHLRAAEFFAAQSKNIENTLQNLDEAQTSNHRAYITAAILSSVAFLEASINEFFLSAVNHDTTALPIFDSKTFQLFTQFWNDVEKYPILRKYQIALALSGKSSFSTGAPLYQDAESMVKLRDCLVHYKPEWDDEQGTHQKLESRLKGKFNLNKYSFPNALWFPHQCLGAGCAEWAVATARHLSDDFCKELGIPMRSV
jgi:hypothetical protein